MTAVSPDIRHFPEPQWLVYPGADARAPVHQPDPPYYRAPHLFMGFPMRYTDRDWSDTVFDLPGVEERMARAQAHPRYGTAVTDAVFMASRDGLTFKRWPEAFIRPGPQQQGSWVYGDNMIVWGMVETPSAPRTRRTSCRSTPRSTTGRAPTSAFRRYTLRSTASCPWPRPQSGGEIVTKPLIFDGGNLALNLETSGAGGVQVEIQDAAGQPLPGYALADCPAICGDDSAHIVRWEKTGGDVRPSPARPCGCASCSTTPTCTPSSSCPTSPSRRGRRSRRHRPPGPVARAARPRVGVRNDPGGRAARPTGSAGRPTGSVGNR